MKVQKNEPEGSFYIDPRVIGCTAEENFHLRFHAQTAEGEPAKNLGVVVAGDGVDVLNVDVFHGGLLSECLALTSLTL